MKLINGLVILALSSMVFASQPSTYIKSKSEMLIHQCTTVRYKNCSDFSCRSPSVRGCLQQCRADVQQRCQANPQLTRAEICRYQGARTCFNETCFNTRQRNCVNNCLAETSRRCR